MLHPENSGGDTALFDQAGLLRERAVMAHGTCLTEPELKILGQRGTALAHCPLSNFFFGDRVLQVRRAMQLGVKVGPVAEAARSWVAPMQSATDNITYTAVRACIVAFTQSYQNSKTLVIHDDPSITLWSITSAHQRARCPEMLDFAALCASKCGCLMQISVNNEHKNIKYSQEHHVVPM